MVRINVTSRCTKNTKDCQDSKVWYGVLSNPTESDSESLSTPLDSPDSEADVHKVFDRV